MASRIVERSQQPSLRTWAGAVSVGMSLIFASAMFAQLQTSFNRIFEVKTRPIRVWFVKRLFSVGLVFVFILFLFLSSILLQFLNRWNVEHYRWVLMFLSALLALKFLPEKQTRWVPAILGGLVTTVGFELGNALFGVYLKATAVASAYGATGALLAFLLWIYYSALILLFGAEVCYALSYRRR
jgi:membrane protein